MTTAQLPLGHRPPLLDEKPETLFRWLEDNGMTDADGSMDLPNGDMLAPNATRA